MRSIFLLLLLSVFWVSCNFQETAERPSVSDEKMARVIADLAIADAATNGITGYEKDSLMQAYFQQVLQLHGLTLEQHKKTCAYLPMTWIKCRKYSKMRKCCSIRLLKMGCGRT